MDPTSPSESIVTLQDVSVSYGARQALSHVTATFPRGATGLLGANGAGKSTLIRAILGLITPYEGRIDVLGLSAVDSALDIRTRIGYVPESDAYIPGLNAVASVAYCGELAGLFRADALQRAHDVLSFVGLDEARYRDVDAFSMRMKQKLKLAQALVHDPELLLVDEPTNGLDPKGRDELLALITDLGHGHGLSVIFSSHLLPDVERTCDAVVVLNAGVVAAAGCLKDWHPTERRYYEVRIKGDLAAFTSVLTVDGMTWTIDEEQVVRIATPDANPQRIFAVANRACVQVRHLRAPEPTLEDLFVQATSDSQHDKGRTTWTAMDGDV